MKPLAITPAGGSTPIQLGKSTVADRTYPLSRSVYIYIDRTPGEPVDPRVKEFLTYVLSREGQEAVARSGAYLPLTPQLARGASEAPVDYAELSSIIRHANMSSRRMPMRRTQIVALITTALAATPGSAQNLDGLPLYQGNNDQFGEIRIWGNETMLQMLTAWELGIHEYQRGLRFADVLPSGAAAIGALYTGVADLGLMGHHSWPMEILAFNEVYGYDPLEITVATGAYDVPAKMPANVIYVNKKNPLVKLTVQQLDGIFAAQRTGGWNGTHWSTLIARGPEGNIRIWGQLGLTGEWADKPIHPYAYDLSANSFCLSMQRMAFQGGEMWNPELHEFALNEVVCSSNPARVRPRAAR